MAYLQALRVPTTSIRIMTQILDQESLDAGALLDRAGLTRLALADPDVVVSGVQELDFQRRFIQQTGDRPDLWMQTGLHYRWLHYGLGGIAASTAPSLHDLASSMPVWSHMTYSMNAPMPVRNSDSDTITGIEFDLIEVPEALRTFTVFRDMGAVATFFRDVLALEAPFLHYEFGFPDPGVPGLAALLNAERITFDAPRSGYAWGAGNALRPLPNSDPVLHQFYLQRCRRIREQLAGSGSFLEQVLQALEEKLHLATIDELAVELGVSKRTLQRRLQDHGMTFHELRGTVLARRSRTMLRDSNMPIAEIAWAVGYSDPTAFTHAFRRWTGLSPRRFRVSGAAEPGAPPLSGGASDAQAAPLRR